MKKHKSDIDMVLSVLCLTVKDGETLTQGDIAEICNCSRGYIDKVERSAMKKVRQMAYSFGLFDYYKI